MTALDCPSCLAAGVKRAGHEGITMQHLIGFSQHLDVATGVMHSHDPNRRMTEYECPLHFREPFPYHRLWFVPCPACGAVERPDRIVAPLTNDEQLAAWEEGMSVHRFAPDEDASHNLNGAELGGECCPDFSCCQPKLLQPVAIRRAFRAASEDGRLRFLGAFVSAMMADAAPGTTVHVAGGGLPS